MLKWNFDDNLDLTFWPCVFWKWIELLCIRFLLCKPKRIRENSSTRSRWTPNNSRQQKYLHQEFYIFILFTQHFKQIWLSYGNKSKIFLINFIKIKKLALGFVFKKMGSITYIIAFLNKLNKLNKNECQILYISRPNHYEINSCMNI